jgi:hypothetical protein
MPIYSPPIGALPHILDFCSGGYLRCQRVSISSGGGSSTGVEFTVCMANRSSLSVDIEGVLLAQAEGTGGTVESTVRMVGLHPCAGTLYYETIRSTFPGGVFISTSGVLAQEFSGVAGWIHPFSLAFTSGQTAVMRIVGFMPFR